MARPEEHDPDAEPLASHLCDYDDALAAGTPAGASVDGDVPQALRDDLRRAKECVDILNQIWPRDALDLVSTEKIAFDSRDSIEAPTDTLSGPPAGWEEAASTADRPGVIPFRLPGFQILEQIGRGGMGIVYRAVQLSLNREVAVKVLPPHLVHDSLRLRRFRNEAQIAATLSDANILPVFDVLDVGGVPLLVMPYVDGSDLGRIIADRRSALRGDSDPDGLRHPWAALDDRDYLDNVLFVLDRVVDAAAKLHEANVVHRDVKPSNVLIDRKGNVWLTDFGLARLGGDSTLTGTGSQLGSPGYMSPEQWAARDDLDERVDVFGLGATVYHALTLQLPYGPSRIEASTRLARSPRAIERSLGLDAEAVILKALEPDRRNRYANGVELRDDWRRLRQGTIPQARRIGPFRRLGRRLRQHPWGLSDAIAAVVMVVALVLAWKSRQPADRLPAQNSLAALPAASAPAPARTVVLTTDPPGARVVLVPLDPITGEPRPKQSVRPSGLTPLSIPGVPAGDFLVIAQVARSGWFHEVFRHVPGPLDMIKKDRLLFFAHYDWQVLPDGRVQLPTITIPRGEGPVSGMARFDGHTHFLMGEKDPRIGLPAHPVRVDPFFLETTEVSVGAFASTAAGLPESLTEDGGRPPDNAPIVHVTFDQVVAYAERIGKRLPTEEEYEFAATQGGKTRFPWGDDDTPLRDPVQPYRWRFGNVDDPDDVDRTPTTPPVYGLLSNVAEWTGSGLRPYPGGRPMPEFAECRVIRGGTFAVAARKPPSKKEVVSTRLRQTQFRSQSLPGVGFRCARSVRPRYLEE